MILETSSSGLRSRQPRFSIIFKIHSQQFREGEYKLSVRELQESFLVTTWAEVPALTGLFERSDKGMEIFMATMRVGVLNTRDPL